MVDMKQEDIKCIDCDSEISTFNASEVAVDEWMCYKCILHHIAELDVHQDRDPNFIKKGEISDE
jgi:hypothetical protein